MRTAKRKEPMDSYSFMSLSALKQRRLIGEKVETERFGLGKVAQIDDGRIMVKISLKAKDGTRKDIYLADAYQTGDLENIYSKNGDFQGNVNTHVFKF